jgi:proline iminopeptidase
MEMSDGGFLERRGGSIWYKAAGRKSATGTVYLHGGPGYNAFAFERIAGPALERELTMVYLDQRGCGRSAHLDPGADAGVAATVADLEAIRRKCGFTNLNFIAHSFGGLIALEYLHAHREHTGRILLAEVSPDLKSAQVNQLEQAVRIFGPTTPGLAELARGPLPLPHKLAALVAHSGCTSDREPGA